MAAIAQLKSPPMTASTLAVASRARAAGPGVRAASRPCSAIEAAPCRIPVESPSTTSRILPPALGLGRDSCPVVTAVVQHLLKAIEDRLDLLLELGGFLGAELDELVLRLGVHHLLAVELDPVPDLDGARRQVAAGIVVDHLLQVGR